MEARSVGRRRPCNPVELCARSMVYTSLPISSLANFLDFHAIYEVINCSRWCGWYLIAVFGDRVTKWSSKFLYRDGCNGIGKDGGLFRKRKAEDRRWCLLKKMFSGCTPPMKRRHCHSNQRCMCSHTYSCAPRCLCARSRAVSLRVRRSG